MLISTTMCQGLAVRSLRSSSKVCDAWSTEATTQLVREIEKTHITNLLWFVFLHCPPIVCLQGYYPDNVTKLLIVFSMSSINLRQHKNFLYQSHLMFFFISTNGLGTQTRLMLTLNYCPAIIMLLKYTYCTHPLSQFTVCLVYWNFTRA